MWFSTQNLIDAHIIVKGMPLERTTTYLKGTGYAPKFIRMGFENVENYDMNKGIYKKNIFDDGDLDFFKKNLSESLNHIEEYVKALKKKAFFIGGEHTITYPIIKAFKKKVKDLIVIQIDAHTDMSEHAETGGDIGHDTVMMQIVKLGIPVYSIGIRSSSKEIDNKNYTIINSIGEIINKLKDKNIYLTVDLDVLDPLLFPCVGTPAINGWHTKQLIKELDILKHTNIISADIVEFNPACNNPLFYSSIVAEIIMNILRIMD